MEEGADERPSAGKLFLLGIGIYVAPYIFAWFTLKPGYPRWFRIISFCYGAVLVVGLAAFIGFGGDRWPISVDNRSPAKIEFSYLHKDYDHWSAPIAIDSGKATRLALFHFFEDVKGIIISDGANRYRLTQASLYKFYQICSGKVDCFVNYLGGGRIQVSRAPLADIRYESTGNAE